MQRSTWVVSGLFLVLISGCGTSGDATEPGGSTLPTDAGVGMEGDASGAVVDDAALGDTGSPASGASVTSGVEESQPAGDEAASVDEQLPLGVLRASDPAAVALSAGTPVLVEFFAFW